MPPCAEAGWGQVAKIPYWIVMKFCIGLGVPDFITHAKFCDRWFTGFGDGGGQISHISIDFHWLLLSSLKHASITVPACDIIWQLGGITVENHTRYTDLRTYMCPCIQDVCPPVSLLILPIVPSCAVYYVCSCLMMPLMFYTRSTLTCWSFFHVPDSTSVSGPTLELTLFRNLILKIVDLITETFLQSTSGSVIYILLYQVANFYSGISIVIT